MSSVGPQLPPHLMKRKRTPEDDEPDSPTSKRGRSQNADEIDLDSSSSSDDSYGPSAPNAASKRQSIGPTLPSAMRTSAGPVLTTTTKPSLGPTLSSSRPSVGPSLPPANDDEIDLSDSDTDSVGPSLTSTSQNAQLQSQAPRRVLGPAPPPADLSTRPAGPPADSGSDSDSNDDYTPALPNSEAALQRRQHASIGPALPSDLDDPNPAPKRDDWMLAPPTSSSSRAPDPTKLKARSFASGRSVAAGGGGSGGGISSIWTETPEEKRKRLEDAVLGRGGDSAPQQAASGGSKKRSKTREERERERKIEEYTAQTRGKSLYEEHQGKQNHRSSGGSRGKDGGKDEEDDDPSQRAFDKEKDMALGGKIGTAQRRELVSKSANFGGRFQKGSYL